MAFIAMLALTIIQIVIFILWPPPTTVDGFFTLFLENAFLGLLSMDLLYMINNTLLIIVYLGLYAALRRDGEAPALIALVLGLVGIAAYYASNTAFEMLSLSHQFAAATSDAQRAIFQAGGQVMLETYRGTAFDTYYVLNAIALLIFAWIMRRGTVFSKTANAWAWAAGILMIIPSTAGMVGLVFSLLSLIPWMVFCVLAAKRLFALAKSGTNPTD